jgi:GT2 family glycosyltransferase
VTDGRVWLGGNVDNESRDASVPMLAGAFLNGQLVINDRNMGYAMANARGLRKAQDGRGR